MTWRPRSRAWRTCFLPWDDSPTGRSLEETSSSSAQRRASSSQRRGASQHPPWDDSPTGRSLEEPTPKSDAIPWDDSPTGRSLEEPTPKSDAVPWDDSPTGRRLPDRHGASPSIPWDDSPTGGSHALLPWDDSPTASRHPPRAARRSSRASEDDSIPWDDSPTRCARPVRRAGDARASARPFAGASALSLPSSASAARHATRSETASAQSPRASFVWTRSWKKWRVSGASPSRTVRAWMVLPPLCQDLPSVE